MRKGYSEDGSLKKCTRCFSWKPIDDYWPNALRNGKTHTKDGELIRKGECKKCTSNLNKIWLTPKKQKNIDLRKKYGISLDDFERMLLEQNRRCAICKTEKPGGKGSFHVDHCHETNLIRGLLCHHCNIALGCFRENIDILNSAVKYLRKFT